jgi:predicted hydrocarbon binding protein
VGKLFNKPENIDEVINEEAVEQKEPTAILIPKSVTSVKQHQSIGNGGEMLFAHTLSTIYSLGDADDFRFLTEEIAKSFFNEIVEDAPLLNWLKENDLEFLINYLNRMFITYKLGYVQLHISEEERENFEIYLYDSLTVSIAKRFKIEEEQVCSFYEALFKLLFSKIFEQNVEVKEKLCSIQADESRCVFDIKMR